jgi:hypothetical protein
MQTNANKPHMGAWCAWHTQVLELLLDRKAADARHSREVSAREAEIARLQEYIDQELSELQQRQAQVRLANPLRGLAYV